MSYSASQLAAYTREATEAFGYYDVNEDGKIAVKVRPTLSPVMCTSHFLSHSRHAISDMNAQHDSVGFLALARHVPAWLGSAGRWHRDVPLSSPPSNATLPVLESDTLRFGPRRGFCPIEMGVHPFRGGWVGGRGKLHTRCACCRVPNQRTRTVCAVLRGVWCWAVHGGVVYRDACCAMS